MSNASNYTIEQLQKLLRDQNENGDGRAFKTSAHLSQRYGALEFFENCNYEKAAGHFVDSALFINDYVLHLISENGYNREAISANKAFAISALLDYSRAMLFANSDMSAGVSNLYHNIKKKVPKRVTILSESEIDSTVKLAILRFYENSLSKFDLALEEKDRKWFSDLNNFKNNSTEANSCLISILRSLVKSIRGAAWTDSHIAKECENYRYICYKLFKKTGDLDIAHEELFDSLFYKALQLENSENFNAIYKKLKEFSDLLLVRNKKNSRNIYYCLSEALIWNLNNNPEKNIEKIITSTAEIAAHLRKAGSVRAAAFEIINGFYVSIMKVVKARSFAEMTESFLVHYDAGFDAEFAGSVIKDVSMLSFIQDLNSLRRDLFQFVNAYHYKTNLFRIKDPRLRSIMVLYHCYLIDARDAITILKKYLCKEINKLPIPVELSLQEEDSLNDETILSVGDLTESNRCENKGSATLAVIPYLENKTRKLNDPQVVDSLAKSICGMLNSNGGIINIGILEKCNTKKIPSWLKYLEYREHLIVGINLEFGTEWDKCSRRIEEVINTIDRNINPLIQISKVEINNFTVARITIAQPKEANFFYNKKYYVRCNTRTQQLEGRNIIEYINAKAKGQLSESSRK